MVQGKYKSRSLRRVFRKTPGGRVVLHYGKRKPSAAKCANCKAELFGVPRAIPSRFGKFPKTQRRPERPFGGYYCGRCMRESIKSGMK